MEFFRKLTKWRKEKTPTSKIEFCFSVAFLVCFIIGMFGTPEGARGWKFLMSRTGESIVPMIIYSFASSKEE